MELTFEKTTRIALGYATQADAFQCGREAAQMAKSQVSHSSNNDMVLAFCPNGVHFKDFIEGVRLVTGEDHLVGVPVCWVISNDLPSLDTCVVAIIQLASVHFTIASTTETSTGLDTEITSLISQCRHARGNARKLYEFRGLLLLENRPMSEKDMLANGLAADMGLEPWIVGVAPSGCETNWLVCRNQILKKGLVGIEFFSNSPFGIGTVSTGSFSNEPHIYREAVKSSLRDSVAHLADQKPALGFIFINSPAEKISRDDLWDIFRSASAALHNVPLIMIPSAHQFSRSNQRSTTTNKDSVITLLVPH